MSNLSIAQRKPPTPAVIEYDISKSDLAVAKKSIAILKNDIENGYDHLLLVRAGSKNRALDLYQNIYKKLYNNYITKTASEGTQSAADRICS